MIASEKVEQPQQPAKKKKYVGDPVMGSRLRLIRRALNMKQAEVAEVFNIQEGQSNISGIERGRIPIGKYTRVMYVTQLGASKRFIETGEGPMFARDIPQKPTRERGNMVLVDQVSLPAFLAGKPVRRVVYSLQPGYCWAFETGPAPPPHTQPGSLLVSVPLNNEAPKLGTLLVCQQTDRLVMGWLKTVTDEQWQLETGEGLTSVNPDEVARIYRVVRVDFSLANR